MSGKYSSTAGALSADDRASGLLLHLTSLPTRYGIGDLGPSAFAWIDRLHDAGQRWWQWLPVAPTGSCNSPYSALSSFAGNGLLISPERLVEEGVLGREDCETSNFSTDAVDYAAVIAFKSGLINKVRDGFAARKHRSLQGEYDAFCETNAHWLEDYALFRVLKSRQNNAAFTDWPPELLHRRAAALAAARRDLAAEIEAIRIVQFLFFRQARELRRHAQAKGVRLIGDLPFYVSMDSCDVWANPEFFQLDEHLRPTHVGGVPPDAFSAAGQRWGNPVYDWDRLRQSGYRWCIDRFRSLLAYVDVIRLDHFRGFAAAWYVPADAESAETGAWIPGPGADFFDAVQSALQGLPFLAEDLGLITPDVTALLNRFHLPGTRVLQFAFDGASDNPHHPENHIANSVVYTGTHDNPTTRDWFQELTDLQREKITAYMKHEISEEQIAWEFIRLAWTSRAGLAIAPLQDLLNLGPEGRMNRPGHAEGNWRWLCTEQMLSTPAWQSLYDLSAESKRLRADARSAPLIAEVNA